MNISQKLNRLTWWQAALALVVIGFLVYSRGLTTPFIGDDSAQIVNNLPVHSISHIKLFFEGGTFYNGQGVAPLTGPAYRPLMTTMFSVLYTIFGAHTFPFHLLQLLLCIGSSVLVYLFLSYSLTKSLALLSAVIFLVHPIDSQVVYALPSMQDALVMFFGMLALWLLLKFKSHKSLLLVVGALFMALFAKESAALFILMAVLYLALFDRSRLLGFSGMFVIPAALYMVLRIHAIGLFNSLTVAPIDRIGLGGRLLTLPSIPAFYLFKLVYPAKLASGYYWVHPHMSLKYVVLPLLVDLIVAAALVYVGYLVWHRASKAQFMSYLFFSAWLAVGMGLVSQIVPLDMTACEAWFYFPMVGLLGMLGIAVTALVPKPHRLMPMSWALVAILLIVLGGRTALRGSDRASEYQLARYDVAASQEDFIAYNEIAVHYFTAKSYEQAHRYALQSVAIFPEAINNNTLGEVLLIQGDYPGAYQALTDGIGYQAYYPLIDNLSILTAFYGDPHTNEQFLLNATAAFPGELHPWLYLAILEYNQLHNPERAKTAIAQAHSIAPQSAVVSQLYERILTNQPLLLNITR